MSRAYTVCTHPQRETIDRALMEGEACAQIAARYCTIGRMALQRHKAEHLPERMARAREAAEVAVADDPLKEVRALRSKAYRILMAAEGQGDYRTALAGIREARGCLELLAKLPSELDERPQANLILSPEWTGLRARIVEALAPYPEARRAIVEALDGR